MQTVHRTTQNRLGFGIRGAGTVQSMLVVFAGFFALSWGVEKIQNFGNEEKNDVRLRQVASELVKVSESANVAGLKLVEGTVSQTVRNLEEGETVDFGFFAGQHYGVGKLDQKTRDGVEKFLYIEGDKLLIRENR